MTDDVVDGGAVGTGPAEYNLLQQQLVAVRARLDRQVGQLTRLNELSDDLLQVGDGRSVEDVFAEAVLDVLDVAVGAVWVMPSARTGTTLRCGAIGADAAAWRAAGPALAEWIGERRGTRRLEGDGLALLAGSDLVDPLVCRSTSRDGAVVAVVLAANTARTAGNYEPVGDETVEILAMVAEKLAAKLDHEADEQVMRLQVQQLAESEERLALVLQGTNDGWWDWDLHADECFVSLRWIQMLGDSSSTALRRRGFWFDRVHPQDRETFEWTLQRAFAGTGEAVETEVRLLRADGDYLPVLVRGTISRDEGRTVRFAGSILDLSERKRHEAAVHRLAFYDPLTDLPNRRLLVDRVQQELGAARAAGQNLALLMLDLDRFKSLNDTHGHASGDELLRAAARRLLGAVRGGDTVARLSGDEFVVLLASTGRSPSESRQATEKVGRHILEVMDEPYELEVGTVHHSASIGAAITNEPGLSVDTLLRRADVALYEAKGAGRNTLRVFEDQMQQRVDERSELDSRLHLGFEHGEFQVVYQPQVDGDGQLFGAEALMRWSPPGGAAVGPAEFIPVAEETGFIHVLGTWMFEQVCRQVVTWRPFLPDGFRVAVNLSAPEFLHPELPERIVDTLQRTGARGSEIRLEITEATVVTELEFVADRMDLLRAHGIEFSLDDFGTGYSSLTYLRRLPVSEVKIDRSYVQRFLRDHHDEAIVRAVLTLCDTLNLRVVAEGVETAEQVDMLLAEGCEFFQGYFFGRPLPAPADPRQLVPTFEV